MNPCLFDFLMNFNDVIQNPPPDAGDEGTYTSTFIMWFEIFYPPS